MACFWSWFGLNQLPNLTRTHLPPPPAHWRVGVAWAGYPLPRCPRHRSRGPQSGGRRGRRPAGRSPADAPTAQHLSDSPAASPASAGLACYPVPASSHHERLFQMRRPRGKTEFVHLVHGRQLPSCGLPPLACRGKLTTPRMHMSFAWIIVYVLPPSPRVAPPFLSTG